MIATVHALFGATIGVWVHNIWLAFVLGIISHYLLDFIPHWDYLPKINNESNNLKKIFFDSFASGLIILLVIPLRPHDIFSILAGSIGGLLPDILQFFYLIMGVKCLKPAQQFHYKIHKWKHLSFKQGLIGTFLVIIISILALF